MSNLNVKKGKHLTMEDRILIEYSLEQNYTLKEIAKTLKKDHTTISKEIKRNRFIKESIKKEKDLLSCKNRKECSKKHLCKDACNKLCKKCIFINCYRKCNEYTTKKCTYLNRYPYVCNSCDTVTTCNEEKCYYKAKLAHEKYLDTLKSSKEGINVTHDQIKRMDELISPLVLKGQSLYHISIHHKEEITCSERTLYNYFNKNVFTVRNVDLPKKVKYKPRKKKISTIIKNPSYRIGRTFEDFTKFLEDNPDTPVVEMDTVYGTRSGKVLLTFIFRNCSLMLAFLINHCNQRCVKEVIDTLYLLLGKEVFTNSFPVILTDNGSEFKFPNSLEFDNKGNQRTRIFYCNPMASYQKPYVEKNHEFIRYILPKGVSFEELSQEDITFMMNNINSVARASLNGNTPFKLAQLVLDTSLLEKLSLKHIPADEVYLKPSLFKK